MGTEVVCQVAAGAAGDVEGTSKAAGPDHCEDGVKDPSSGDYGTGPYTGKYCGVNEAVCPWCRYG